MTDKEIQRIISERLCANCPKLNRCFDDLEPCEEYYELEEKLENE